MGLFNKFQSGLEKIVGPFAQKVSQNKFINSLTEGFMASMPITLGIAVIAVLGNLPFKPWMNFLNSTGLYTVAQDTVSLTLSLLAIYVVGSIAYAYTKNQGEKGIIGAVIALASFILLMPLQTVEINKESLSVLDTSYMGSDGIFVAIILGLFIPWLYCILMKKNLRLKLPEVVPPMVSQSLAPTFVVMIIFSLVFAIKYVTFISPYNNIFNLVTTFIGKPIATFGASPISLIIVFTLMNLIWFFGIHPNTILSCYMPILMMTGVANTEAFTQGKALPYLMFSVVASCLQIGGTGNTFGLCIATLFAKSEKYKSMRKLVIPANFFNINEPIIFGFPLMLNPLYFIPMVFSPMVSGFVAMGLFQIVQPNLNPTISMPWVTPGFVSTFMTGGPLLLMFWIIALLIHFVMYLPFFLIDDKAELAKEKELLAKEEKEAVVVETTQAIAK